MKTPHELRGKNLLSLIILLLLVLSLPNALSLNTVEAGEYPSIYIEPEVTEETLSPGENYPISIKTDYTGDDIWAWSFTLTYDPRVLHGGIKKTDMWIGDNVKTMFNTTETPVVQDSEEVRVNQTIMTRIIKRTDTWIGDGVTRTFYTTQPVFPGSEKVRTDRDPFIYRKYTYYTIDYSTGNITFKDAPEIGEKIDVHYDTYGDYAINYEEDKITFPLPTTDTWTGDGENKTFSTTQKPVPGSETVYVNQTYISKLHYSIDYDKGEITFTTAPGVGVEIEATYTYLSAPGVGVKIEATYLYNGVNNGDLITEEEHSSALFHPGTFNNTIGKLSLTEALFFVLKPPQERPTTSGPGTLANITFTVVGFGATNITLGPETALKNPEAEPITDHTQHGYLLNVQPIHDVAVFSLVAPDKAFIRELVSINVTVTNEGSYDETVTVTVSHNFTDIDTTTFALDSGLSEMISFNWNTIGLDPGTYTINATATIDFDEDPSDNTGTKQIELKATHDVAIINILAPTTAAVGELVSVNVTVANQGHYNENVTLTVSYVQRQSLAATVNDVVLNTATANFTLNKGSSQTVSSKWNTTGLKPTGTYDGLKFSYLINATAAVLKSIENPGGIDKDPGDNIATKQIELKLGYDVAVTTIWRSPRQVFVGENVTIGVTVENLGMHNATFEVKITYDSEPIRTEPELSLASGNSTTLTFNWITTDVAPGFYTITAEAILETDGDLTNNLKTTDVSVKSPFGTIVGNVTDASTDLPIEGASVTAGDYTNTTNADGHYIISGVQPGNYTVTVSADGYESSSKTNITVVAGNTTQVDFKLTPTPPPSIPWHIYVATAGAIAIVIVAIAFYFLRIRKPKPT